MQDWTPAAPFPEPVPPGMAPEVTPASRVPRFAPPPPPTGFPADAPHPDRPVKDRAPQDRARWKPLDIPPDLSRLGLHVGTSGYQFQDWAGRFFPPGTSMGEWYPFYQLYFSFLEIDHTFTQEPSIRHFVELERRSKPGMAFSVKVHGDVSNKRIWDPASGRALMRKHAAAVAPLAEAGRFYSFLIQLDEGIERGRKALDYLLETASEAVSGGLDVHIEFRNRTWHQEAVLQSLKDAGVGICNTDLPALPHAFPLKAYATTDKAYVRYCGLNPAGWAPPESGADPDGRDPEASGRGGSPVERLRARNARYDYRYSLAELEERARGQLLLLEKTGAVAAVFKNHVGAKAALNAVQDIHVLLGILGPSPR